MDIVLVEGVGQGLGIRIMVLIETQGVPAVFAPPLPVLDDHVEGNAPILESGGILEDLVRRAVALAAVDVSEHPFGHLGDFASELAVGGDALVGISGEHREIQRRSDGRMEDRGVLGLAPIHLRLVAAHSADLELVLTRGELDDDRSGGRQPGVGKVDHGLAVDGKVLLPGHGLAYIQED